VGRTWQRNAFVILAGLIGLVMVSDVEGQILGRRRRARAVGRANVMPSYGGRYQSSPTYRAPASGYGTYGVVPGTAAGFGSVEAGIATPNAGLGATGGANTGGVVGASANVDVGPSAGANRPGVSAPPNARDIPGQPNENRPLPEADSREPANNNERLAPLQGDRREVTPPDRRNQDDAPPPPPAP
jgi:hypothetical protein